MSQPHTFLLFTLGPVQDFIAAARKTKDLFAGSLMLSYLSAKAIETVLLEGKKKSLQPKMLFPDIDLNAGKLSNDDLRDSSIPNRFLVKFDSVELQLIDGVADVARQSVLSEFKSISASGKEAFSRKLNAKWSTDVDAGKEFKDEFCKMLWNEQVDKFLECYWVVYLLNEKSYGENYRNLEQLSGKRKALRNFEELLYHPNEKGQPKDKCTLITGLSAIHTSKVVGHNDMKSFWDEQAKRKPGDFRRHERLSAVAIAKRFFLEYLIEKKTLFEKKDARFPSTTTIAAATFNQFVLNKFADADLQKSVREYAKAVREFHKAINSDWKYVTVRNLPRIENQAKGVTARALIGIDSDYLLDETYIRNRVQREFDLSDSELQTAEPVIVAAHDAARSVRSEAIKLNGRGIPKYYAILFFDGDHMGKWLSGGMGNTIDGEQHKTLSNSLRLFSTRARHGRVKEASDAYKIVEGDHLGKIIYAGGDDVVAFVALEDCLDVAFEVRTAFELWMKKGGCGSATGSLGMAIAHHQMNLQQVLQEARKAEHHAKETLGRDAFGIALLKRSGEHFTTGAKWFPQFKERNTEGNEEQTKQISGIDVLKSFATFIGEKDISPKFVHDLEDERKGLEGIPDEAVLSEMKRLLLRRTKPQEETKRKVGQYFEESLKPLYTGLTTERNKLPLDTHVPSSLEQFVDLLMVAQFIGQGGAR